MPGELLWESDFSNIDVLRKEWNIEYAKPRKNNNEMQSYDDSVFKFDNSELVISTINQNRNIVSGRINTKNKLEFQFGYIEALIKFSAGPGLWPAFWLLGNREGWPNCGEIDIMEYVNWRPNCVYGTLHGPGYCAGNAYGSGAVNILNKSLANEYHKYAIEWKPDTITWFLDDKPFFTANHNNLQHIKHTNNWVYNNKPFYIILNNAVGGAFGNANHWSEQNIYDTLPRYNEMRIKYVKIYKTSDNIGHLNTHIRIKQTLDIDDNDNDNTNSPICKGIYIPPHDDNSYEFSKSYFSLDDMFKKSDDNTPDSYSEDDDSSEYSNFTLKNLQDDDTISSIISTEENYHEKNNDI